MSVYNTLTPVSIAMRIAIAGGTGTVGAEAARELERRGHEVRVLSRHAPEHPVDLRDGSGLSITRSTWTVSAPPTRSR